jgi:hypothetical protein
MTTIFQTMKIRPQAIQSKRDSRMIKAFDSQHNAIQVNDFVRVIDGQFGVWLCIDKYIYNSKITHLNNESHSLRPVPFRTHSFRPGIIFE